MLPLDELLGLTEIAETLLAGGVGGTTGAEEVLGGTGAGVGAAGVPVTALEAVPGPTEFRARILIW